MKKIFTQRLFTYMLAAFIVTITAIFVLQTVITQRSNTASSRDKLQDVKEKLISNAENIERLTSNLSEDNLAKTRAFADMLAADKTLAGDENKLNEIKDRLMVNELHIIDEDGIITSSTIDAYVGFDMKSGEQSNAFMVIVADPSIEIVQEPQRNVAVGVVMPSSRASVPRNHVSWLPAIQTMSMPRSARRPSSPIVRRHRAGMAFLYSK